MGERGGRARYGWLLVGLAVVAVLVAALGASAASGQSPLPGVPPRLGTLTAPALAPRNAKLDSRLSQIATAARTQGLPAAVAAARTGGLGVNGGLVHAVVQSHGSDAAARSAVAAAGGRVTASYGNLVDALVPPAALAALAGNPAVSYVRAPFKPLAQAVNGEEVAATNASALQAAGVTGSGAGVAVIDLGFGDLAAKEAAGEIPSNATVVDMCPDTGINNEVHGTAVAEIVHEMAPSAPLTLICVEDEVSLGNAEAYVKSHGIKIVNHSVAWLNTSRGDGTGGPGTPDAIVADANANGILWVNAAGNYAQNHWSGTFVDDGSRFNQFDPAPGGDENGFYIAAGGQGCVFLKWDAWSGTPQDFDLYLFPQTGTDVAASFNDQVNGGPPTEALCYTNPAPTAEPFYAAIYEYSATAAPRFDMFVTGDVGPLEFDVPGGSLTEPATSPNVFAAGAICWQDDSLEPYSSQGPTIDGRTKPDIAGQDSESSATYGGFTAGGCGASGFTGTSAASPTVAGAAALLESLHPGWTNAQLVATLSAQAVDLGPAGPDNQFGAGALHLVAPALATHLDVQAPASATANAPFSVTVRALDALNDAVPSYTGTVHFTTSDGAAVLPADYTFTAADAGVHTFTNLFTLKTSGAQSVSAADTVAPTINGTASIAVAAAVDVTNPTVTITSPTDGTFYKQNATVNAAYSCQDEAGGSGLASCVGDVANGSPLATGTEGAHSFTVTAKDNAGNTASKTVTYKVDGTAPTISVTLPAEGGSYKQGSPIGAAFTCDDGTGSGVASCSATSPFSTATLGPHQFVVHAVDKVGNAADKIVNYTIVDLTKPTVTITTPADGAQVARGATVNAGYTCQDEAGGSGIATCVGTVANGAAIDTSSYGSKAFEVDATDNAGNTTQVIVHYTVADLTKPTVTITTPADAAFYKQGATVNASYSCQDEVGGSGIASCVGDVASGSPVSTAGEGSHSFTVTATDNAGNTATKTVHYTVDGTAPVVTVTLPAEGASYSLGSALTAVFACDDGSGSGVASCTVTSPLDTSTAGPHSFVVHAVDKVGNATDKTVHYTIGADVTKPTVTITAPADAAFYKQGAAVNASYSCQDEVGGSGIASCVGDLASGSPVSTAGEGSHSFTVTATDNAGNTTSKTVHYTVDGTAPVVTVTLPVEGASYSQGAAVTAVFACDDGSGSGVASCTATSPLDTSTPGAHSFVVHAVDKVGNATDKTVHYTVTAAPSSGGGGGGGGGGGAGGVPPDLHVDLTASATTPPAVGAELLYTIKVSTKNVGSSSDVRLDVTLPAGFTVTRIYADRGPGCTGTAPSLVCDVAWISPGTGTTVMIWGTVGQAGELDATATVTSLLETELAANLSDNTATLKLVPPPAPFTPPPAVKPPILKLTGRTPAAAHVGKTAVVRATLSLDKGATLKLTAVHAGSRPLTFLRGSKLGKAATGRARTQLTYAAKGGGTVPVLLRISYGALKRGQTYKMTIVATGSDGRTSRLVIPFRR